MMQPEAFRAFATVYWQAGWQLHIHVNGDAGLDLVLDTSTVHATIRAPTTAR